MNLDVPGLIMRVRRMADLSQRDLALRLGVSRGVVAKFETAERSPDLVLLGRILAIAGLRFAVLDREGSVVPPMSDDELPFHELPCYERRIDASPVDDVSRAGRA